MAEKPNLTPNDDGVVETEETPTLENTSEGQEEKETPTTTLEGLESTPEGGEEDNPYKKRYADSSREAQRLSRENEQLKIQMAELAQKPNIVIEAPSDKELSAMVPDWDILSPTEQRLMKENVFIKREIAEIKRSNTLTTKELLWERDFGEMATKPEFSALKAKKQEFSLFCSKNPYTNIEVLARSFLFDESKNIGAREIQEKLSRKGLEKGSGGTRVLTSTGLTDEEIGKIMVEKPLLYQKMIKEGKIK